jgi:hypothetical protein
MAGYWPLLRVPSGRYWASDELPGEMGRKRMRLVPGVREDENFFCGGRRREHVFRRPDQGPHPPASREYFIIRLRSCCFAISGVRETAAPDADKQDHENGNFATLRSRRKPGIVKTLGSG